MGSRFGTELGTALGTRFGTYFPGRGGGGAAGPVFTTGLIDDLLNLGEPLPQHALYVHRLYSAYTGDLMTVRSAAGGTDGIGYTAAGLLDTAAIASFCGSNDGFLVTWNDQGPSARHHTQANTAKQAKIYDGATGQVLVAGVAGNPAPLFSRAAAQSVNVAGWLNSASAYTRFYIAHGNATGTQAWVTHEPMRWGCAGANVLHYQSGGGTNRQFTAVTAITTLGAYRSSFAGGTQHGSIPIVQNGANLVQASVANPTNTVTFTTVTNCVGNQGDASANAQNGPLICDISWAAVLGAPANAALDLFGADNI